MEKRVSARIPSELRVIKENLQLAERLDEGIRLAPDGLALAAQHIFPTLELTGRKLDAKLAACDMYLANVLLAYKNGKAIHASRNSSTLSNHTVKLHAVNALVNAQWVEMAPGFYNADQKTGFETRYFPRREMVDLFEGVENPFVYVPSEMLILKDKHKVEIPFPTDLDTKTLDYLSEREWQIFVINNVNRGHVLRYRIWDAKSESPSKRLGYTFSALKAPYNNGSFDHGGRLYGKFQNLRKGERQTLTIDGKPTVELDFACLHPAMLYNMEGLPLEGDAYSLYPNQSDVVRGGIKTAFNALLNAHNDASALKASNLELSDRDKNGRMKPCEELLDARLLREEFDRRKLKFTNILQDLKSKHNSIGRYFGLGYGLKLQNKDVELVYAVCRHFCERKIPILPVHDSFIVQAEYGAELRATMRDVYFGMFGFEPQIK